MYAIIQNGGKQYKVKAGEAVEIEKLDAKIGDEVTFGEVLAIGEEGGKVNIGAPLLAGAKVTGKVSDQFRAKKIIAFKMKRRKGYRLTIGHRQYLTRVEITAIEG